MGKTHAVMALAVCSIGAAVGACAVDGAPDTVDRERVAQAREGLGTREVLTQHNDNFRTGAILSETVLSPATVLPDRFGLRYSRTVDGQIYAQPLYVEGVATRIGTRNLVIAATMANTVYAFDASNVSTVPSAGVVWRKEWAAPAATPDNWGFLKGAPTIGIQSTPVIDRANNRLYVVMATTLAGRRAYSLYALSLGDGSLLASAPINGSFRASDGRV